MQLFTLSSRGADSSSSITTGFEGYSAEDSSLDPNVLSELVSDEDKVAINRTHIECNTDYSFKVTVTFCGMTAVYPAEDITLD